MRHALERLLNEIPTIAVGLWALLRVVGIDVGEDVQAAVVDTVESVGGLALMLLVRANIAGPVTLAKLRDHDHD